MCVMRMSGASLRLKWEQEQQQQQLDERSSSCRGGRQGEGYTAYTATTLQFLDISHCFVAFFVCCECAAMRLLKANKRRLQSVGVHLEQLGREGAEWQEEERHTGSWNRVQIQSLFPPRYEIVVAFFGLGAF